MSKKALPNRISKVVAPDAVSKIRKAIALIEEVLGSSTSISDDDYKALRKIADKLKRECDDVYDIAVENTEFIDDSTTIEEMEKDKKYYELCDMILSMLKALMIKLTREQNIAGAEYHNACSLFEENVAVKAGRNNAKAQIVKGQLDNIERNRKGGNSGDSKDTSPAAK